MSVFHSELTVDDFSQLDWQQIIESAERTDCRIYSRLFFRQAKQYEEEGNLKAANVCILFGIVTSFSLHLETPKTPYKTDWGIPIALNEPKDLTQSHWQILLDLAPTIRDAELRARIADVIYLLKIGNYHMGQLAIDAYLEIASALEDTVNWTHGARRIERAFQIGQKLGKNHQYFAKVIAYIEATLHRLNGDDPLWFSHKLMTLLLNSSIEDYTKYASLANKIASNALRANDWRRARDYWELEYQWFGMANQLEDQQRIKLQIANSYVAEAKNYIDQETPDYWKAAHELGRSMEAMRRIGAPKESIDEVHKLLLFAEEKTMIAMNKHEFSVDVSDVSNSAREAVKGKSLRDAILTIAGSYRPMEIEYLRQQALEYQREATFLSFVQIQQVDEKGRVTGVYPPMSSTSEEKREKALNAQMRANAIQAHMITAFATVRPMLYEINLEHYIRLQDVFEFVRDNPFIPEGREIIYARGLYAGLIGDFLVASHLLIPQIENSIRYILYQKQIITTKYDEDGIQDVYPLGSLLSFQETKDIFGPNLVFELQGLLTEHLGANLRNRVAHGLLHANVLDGDISVYFWWLTLYLCCHPALMQTYRNDQVDRATPANEEAEISQSDFPDTSTMTTSES